MIYPDNGRYPGIDIFPVLKISGFPVFIVIDLTCQFMIYVSCSAPVSITATVEKTYSIEPIVEKPYLITLSTT